ncbi:hypothetical protein MTP99_018483 [Tenebrio molitor]|nr:hypothetical protein MTP99_018483 [Tenebrio molitor]
MFEFEPDDRHRIFREASAAISSNKIDSETNVGLLPRMVQTQRLRRLQPLTHSCPFQKIWRYDVDNLPYYEGHVCFSEYGRLAIKLIQLGANINPRCRKNDSLLHIAVRKYFLGVAKCLIERGVDINAQNDDGKTPLRVVGDRQDFREIQIDYKQTRKDFEEGVSLLLYYVLEHLFDLTYDSYSECVICLKALEYLMLHESPLFYKVLDRVTEVGLDNCVLAHAPFWMKTDYLRVFLEKFDHVVDEMLSDDNCCSTSWTWPFNESSIDNFRLLLESHLAPKTIEYIQQMSIPFIMFMVQRKTSVKAHVDLKKKVYNLDGYNDLFKTMLHMIPIPESREVARCDVLPRIICDIHFDLETFLKDPHDCSVNSMKILLDYFANPRFRDYCLRRDVNSVTKKVKRLPTVPILVELARDATRKFLISRYKITRAAQFYSLLKWLPISTTHEKILSFETPLYR